MEDDVSIVQAFYGLLLKPFVKVNKYIPWKARRLVVMLCAFCMMCLPLAARIDSRFLGMFGLLAKLHGYGARHRVLIIAVLLAVMIAASAERVAKVAWNSLIYWLWMTWGLLVMVAGCFHNIGYGFLSMMFVITVMFPCLYYAWMCRGDIDELYDTVAAAVMIEAYLYFICCAVAAPMGQTHTRYSGLNDNSNSFAITAICFLIASLYLTMRAKGLWKLLPAAALGASSAMLLMSVSRTSMLSGAMVALIWLILWFRDKLGLKSLVLVLATALLVSGASYLTLTRGHDPLKLLPEISAADELAVYADDGEDEEEDDGESEIEQRFDLDGGLNRISTGRIGIWQSYAEKFNLTGNDISYALPLKVVYYNGSTRFYSSPHNTIIEVTFRAGIPAGILFALIELAGAAYVLSVIFGKRRHAASFDAFCAMAISAFCSVGMLESLFKAFKTDLLILMLIAALPLLAMGHRDAQRM